MLEAGALDVPNRKWSSSDTCTQNRQDKIVTIVNRVIKRHFHIYFQLVLMVLFSLVRLFRSFYPDPRVMKSNVYFL